MQVALQAHCGMRYSSQHPWQLLEPSKPSRPSCLNPTLLFLPVGPLSLHYSFFYSPFLSLSCQSLSSVVGTADPLSTWPVALVSICLVGWSPWRSVPVVGDGAEWAVGARSTAWPGLGLSAALWPWGSHFTFPDLTLRSYNWRADLDDATNGCSVALNRIHDFLLFQTV